MTFSIDTCVVLHIVNKYDAHHEKSINLLKIREDDFILPLSVLTESIETFVKEFNTCSIKVSNIIQKYKDQKSFVTLFKKDYDALILGEMQHRNKIHFYKYYYEIIEKYIMSKDFISINKIIFEHPIELARLIPSQIDKIKDFELIAVEEADSRIKDDISNLVDGISIECQGLFLSFLTNSPDKEHFLNLCCYSFKNKINIDYYTIDGAYYLLMIHCINFKYEKNPLFCQIKIIPKYFLTDC